MSENTIFIRKYINDDENCDLLKVNDREVWRYAGYMGIPDEEEEGLRDTLLDIKKKTKGIFSYKVCYRRVDISWKNDMPVLPFTCESKNLATCIKDCNEIIIFAATIGLEVDRYIARYGRFEPLKGLLLQAYGAERIEALCDYFCDEIKNEAAAEGLVTTARFSPGYGDLPLSLQKDVFELLDCNRKIGISLGESFLMTPSKSVTAIFGIKAADKCDGSSEVKSRGHKCSECKKTDCEYRME